MLVNEANYENGVIESIAIKYFEPGHTFMSADSFHHLVENGMKKKRNIEDFFKFLWMWLTHVVIL